MANDVDDDDIALFRRELGDVEPLRHDKAVVFPPRPPAVPRQTLADQRRVLIESLEDSFDPCDMETGEELLYARPGMQHATMRKLRRGHYSVGAELDLHGMTVPVAKAALAEFLRQCRVNDVRCVRIIHGKGNNSFQQRPVLKGKLASWLQRRDEVLAYVSARPVDGGTGAVYVLLKRA